MFNSRQQWFIRIERQNISSRLSSLPRTNVRHASLTSAIEKGRRREASKWGTDGSERQSNVIDAREERRASAHERRDKAQSRGFGETLAADSRREGRRGNRFSSRDDEFERPSQQKRSYGEDRRPDPNSRDLESTRESFSREAGRRGTDRRDKIESRSSRLRRGDLVDLEDDRGSRKSRSRFEEDEEPLDRRSRDRRPERYDRREGFPNRSTRNRYDDDEPNSRRTPKGHRDGNTTRSRDDRSSQDPSTSKSPYAGAAKQRNVVVPASIPYTTPASEFLYGASTILSALKTKRRKPYKLYLYASPDRTPETESRMETVRKHAILRGVPVKIVSAQWNILMDKMAGGRPHNGIILEASPIPKMPIRWLDRVMGPREPTITAVLDHQSAEDAAINGIDGEITRPYTAPLWSKNARYPLVLMLTSIQDPGNLGSILRTAHYMGVAAVVLATHSTAPITPVVLKASSGAAEAIPLCYAIDIVTLIEQSKGNGWKFLAAASPHSPSAGSSSSKNGSRTQQSQPFLKSDDISSVLKSGPAVLMLGGEGAGLDPRAQKRADALIGIPSAWGRKDIAGVDSLNVGVATGMLTYALLSPGSSGKAVAAENDTEEGSPEQTKENVDSSVSATEGTEEGKMFSI